MERLIDVIHIYHTNDIHSHFESWPQISRFLLTKRDAHREAEEACYLFDIGDHVDRFHPLTEGTRGKGNVTLLNEAGYDAVTIGNNEGITMSKESLSALYTDAEFDVILGNLVDQEGAYPEWAVPSKVYVTALGTRIGVIGATAQYTQSYAQLGWQVSPPREQLRATAQWLSLDTDIIVCLSHMGLSEDELLAVESPHIDIILGAHTHHLFLEGKLIENTLLAATGKFGQYVGHVTVEVATCEKQVKKMSATVYPTGELPVFKEDIQRVNELIDEGKEKMDEIVFFNDEKLSRNLFESSSLSSFFGRAMVAYTGADCALFNAGIFLGSLEKGWVTKGDIHRLLPHPINLCVIELDGAELLEVYELSLNKEWPNIEVKGLGFRGALMGAMIYELLYRNSEGVLFAGNRAVVPDETYSLVTLDMFTFGFFFPSLKNAKKQYYMPELLRDVFGIYGRSGFKE